MRLGFGSRRAHPLAVVLLAVLGLHAGAQRGPGAARGAARPPAAPQEPRLPPELPPEVAAATAPLRLHADTEGRAERLLLDLAGRPGVGFAALWSDRRHGTPTAYVRRFGRGGDGLEQERAVRGSYSGAPEVGPSLALGPEGHGAVVWQLEQDPAGARAFRVRPMDPVGRFFSTERIISSKQGWVRAERKGADRQGPAELWPRAAVDGLGRVHAAWNYGGHVLLQELGGEPRLLDPGGPPAQGSPRLISQHSGPALIVWSTGQEVRALAPQGQSPVATPCGGGDLLGAVEDPRPGRGFWLLLDTGEQAVLRPLDPRGRVSGADVALFDAPLGRLDLASWSEGLALVRQERPGQPLEGVPGGPFRLHLRSADGSASTRPPMLVSVRDPRSGLLAPRVVGAGDRLLVAWSERIAGGLELFGRILRSDGLDLDPEFPLAAALATSNQSRPAAASVTDQRAVAVWEDERSGDARLHGRMIGAAGDPLGAEFTLPMRASGAPFDAGTTVAPAVAMGPGGDFVVAWLRGAELSCQAFHPDVRPKGAVAVVAAELDPARGFAVVRQERYRSWLFAWIAPGQGVLVQRVRGDGTPLAEPTAVSGPGSVAHPALLELADDRVLVAWDLTGKGGAGLRARFLEAELQAASEVLEVSLPPRVSHTGPLLARAPAGGFLMAWTAAVSKSESFAAARQFDRSGEPAGDLLALSEPTGRAAGLTLTGLADGSWVAGWEVAGLAGTRVVVRRLRPGAREPGPPRVLDPPTSGYRVGGFQPVLVGVERGWLGLWVDAHRGAGLDVWCRAVGQDFDLGP